jgi:exodeoxyribonuclease III
MQFRLATWNINSVRLRLDLVERFVQAYKPDILCLQEIKCIDDSFPELPLRALGFSHVAVCGQKGYHGVATLSRIPFSAIERRDICGRGHARHLSVALGSEMRGMKPLVLHNVYVPAGGDIPDPALNEKFRHKLDFLEAMGSWFGGMRGKSLNRMIMVGDLNVAPLPTDVWSHQQLLKIVSHTPAEVERLDRVQASHDWVDVMRRHVPPEQKLYTWWSYRARDWRASNRGRRLDHIWTTPALDGAAVSMTVAEETRDWPRTSDHVPVIADYSLRRPMHTSCPGEDPAMTKDRVRVRSLASRHQLVAAGLGDEELGLGGILLDLLAQAIDVGLQCVSRHAGVIAPDLVQQHVAGHDPLAGAIEIFQDRGLFLGEPDLAAATIDQHLRCRLEGVRADGEDGVLALLVLAELRADAGEEHAELEGLRHIVVGAGLQPEDRVRIGDLRREHDDGSLEAAAAEQLARLAAVEIGKAHIEEHEVDMTAPRELQSLRSRSPEQRLELLMQRKLLAQGLAKLVVIIDDQDLARIAHRRPRPCISSGTL